MKKKDFLDEIKKLSADELRLRLGDMSEELMRLRFRKASGQLNEAHRLSEVRKNIARAQTLYTSKRLSEAGR